MNATRVMVPGTTAARVTVEFDNLPRVARVRPQRNSGVDLDLSAGYSMVTP